MGQLSLGKTQGQNASPAVRSYFDQRSVGWASFRRIWLDWSSRGNQLPSGNYNEVHYLGNLLASDEGLSSHFLSFFLFFSQSAVADVTSNFPRTRLQEAGIPGSLYDGVLMCITDPPTWYFLYSHPKPGDLEMVPLETMNISSEKMRLGIQSPAIRCLNTLSQNKRAIKMSVA